MPSAAEVIERVRALLAVLVVDPTVRVTFGELGEPAPPDEVAARRGTLPDDLLDVLALANGIVITWQPIDDGDGEDAGALRVPTLAGLQILRPAGDPASYVLVDGRDRGMGSYYRMPAAGAPDIIYTLRGDPARQAQALCGNFLEYLGLACDHGFEVSWASVAAHEQHRRLHPPEPLPPEE